MKHIIKNSWLLFRKAPGYIHTMITIPIVSMLVMSFLLAYNNTHNIAVIDLSPNDQGKSIFRALNEAEGLSVVPVKEGEIETKLLSGNIELAVIIHHQSQIEIIGLSRGSEVLSTVEAIVYGAQTERDADIVADVNSVKKKGIAITYALGFMLFKFITATSIMAGLLIRERNNGLKSRIFLSGIRSFSYLTGKAVVQLSTVTITAIVYYLFALIFNFNFGMAHTLYFLFMIIVTNIFSIGVFSVMSTILKEEGMLWSLSTFIFFPMALLSGLFFPYDTMPQWMKAIGAYVPQRWIISAINTLQKTDNFILALPMIVLALGSGLLFYAIAVYRTGKIRSLVG